MTWGPWRNQERKKEHDTRTRCPRRASTTSCSALNRLFQHPFLVHLHLFPHQPVIPLGHCSARTFCLRHPFYSFSKILLPLWKTSQECPEEGAISTLLPQPSRMKAPALSLPTEITQQSPVLGATRINWESGRLRKHG